MRKIKLAFGPVDTCLTKGDWKADSRIEQLVIVSEVVHAPVEAVHIQPKLLEKALSKSDFIIIAVRRLHRYAQNLRIQRNHRSRTGEQNVFEIWSLKNPVVRRMQHQVSRWEIS